jgi:hypothetical protein
MKGTIIVTIIFIIAVIALIMNFKRIIRWLKNIK